VLIVLPKLRDSGAQAQSACGGRCRDMTSVTSTSESHPLGSEPKTQEFSRFP